MTKRALTLIFILAIFVLTTACQSTLSPPPEPSPMETPAEQSSPTIVVQAPTPVPTTTPMPTAAPSAVPTASPILTIAPSRSRPPTPIPPSPTPILPSPSPLSPLPSRPPTPVPPSLTPILPSPSPSPLSPLPFPAQRVVILSIDGARTDYVNGFMADGTMSNLARLAARGAQADYAESVEPSLTAAAHNSIATGCYPNRTGVVSNKYHLSKDKFYWYTSGFDAEPAEPPLWKIVQNTGLTTALLFWPGASPDLPTQSADYTVAYAQREVYGRLHQATFSAAEGWANAPESFSAPQEGMINIKGKDDALYAIVHLLAIDSSDNGMTDYDTFILDLDKEIDAASAWIHAGHWGALVIKPRSGAGAYFKVIASDATKVTVFQSQVQTTSTAPVELLDALNEQFGLYPPEPDDYALEHGWITPQDYWDMAMRQAQWMMDVTLYVYTAYQPDLLLTWQGIVDEAGHEFLMVDERQKDYSAARGAEYAVYYQRAHKLVDEQLGKLLSEVNLSDTAVFVVSDHGMAPIYKTVYVNTILEQAGLLEFQGPPSYYLNTDESQANAVASGGAAHIYINLAGRERPGIVPVEEYEAEQQKIINALRGIVDEGGQPVFARILPRQDLGQLNLNAENAGDVFVQAAPGYALSDWRGAKYLIARANYYGQHGYDATLPGMRGIFIAGGHGIRQEVRIDGIKLVDIAPTAAQMLGLSMPDADGVVLEEILE